MTIQSDTDQWFGVALTDMFSKTRRWSSTKTTINLPGPASSSCVAMEILVEQNKVLKIGVVSVEIVLAWKQIKQHVRTELSDIKSSRMICSIVAGIFLSSVF